jgi:hypothetical protein
MPASNGMPADQLQVTWRKSKRSNPGGNCVEAAALPDGAVAVRNSRHRPGPRWSAPARKSRRSWPERGTASSTTWPEAGDRGTAR